MSKNFNIAHATTILRLHIVFSEQDSNERLQLFFFFPGETAYQYMTLGSLQPRKGSLFKSRRHGMDHVKTSNNWLYVCILDRFIDHD